MNECVTFEANVFNPNRCLHCFKSKSTHLTKSSKELLDLKQVSKYGYLFIAPSTSGQASYFFKRWQRRYFELFENGELTYSLDPLSSAFPQNCIDLSKFLPPEPADIQTRIPYSIVLRENEPVDDSSQTIFLRGESKDDIDSWTEALKHFTCSLSQLHGNHRSIKRVFSQIPRNVSRQQAVNRSRSVASDCVAGESPGPSSHRAPPEEQKHPAATNRRTSVSSSSSIEDATPTMISIPSSRPDSTGSQRCSPPPSSKNHFKSVVRRKQQNHSVSANSRATRSQSLSRDEETTHRDSLASKIPSLSEQSSPARPCLEIHHQNNQSKINKMIDDFKSSWTQQESEKKSDSLEDNGPNGYQAEFSSLPRRFDSNHFFGTMYLKKGWLHKQRLGEREHKRLYCILNNGMILFFPDANASGQISDAVDSIPLRDCLSADISDTRDRYGITIQLPNSSIFLSTLTAGIRDNWLEAINKAILQESLSNKTLIEDNSRDAVTTGPVIRSTSTSSQNSNQRSSAVLREREQPTGRMKLGSDSDVCDNEVGRILSTSPSSKSVHANQKPQGLTLSKESLFTSLDSLADGILSPKNGGTQPDQLNRKDIIQQKNTSYNNHLTSSSVGDKTSTHNNRELEAELNRKTAEIAMLKRQLAERENQALLKQQVSSLSSDASNYKAQIADLEEKLTELTQETNQLHDSESKLKSRCQELAEKNENLETQLAKCLEHSSQANSHFQESTKETLQAADNEMASMTSRCLSLERECSSLKDEIGMMARQLNQVKAHNEEQLKLSERENADLLNKVKSLESQLKKSDEEIAKHRFQWQSLSNLPLHKLTILPSSSQEEISKEWTLDQLVAEFHSLHNKLTSLQSSHTKDQQNSRTLNELVELTCGADLTEDKLKCEIASVKELVDKLNIVALNCSQQANKAGGTKNDISSCLKEISKLEFMITIEEKKLTTIIQERRPIKDVLVSLVKLRECQVSYNRLVDQLSDQANQLEEELRLLKEEVNQAADKKSLLPGLQNDDFLNWVETTKEKDFLKKQLSCEQEYNQMQREMLSRLQKDSYSALSNMLADCLVSQTINSLSTLSSCDLNFTLVLICTSSACHLCLGSSSSSDLEIVNLFSCISKSIGNSLAKLFRRIFDSKTFSQSSFLNDIIDALRQCHDASPDNDASQKGLQPLIVEVFTELCRTYLEHLFNTSGENCQLSSVLSEQMRSLVKSRLPIDCSDIVSDVFSSSHIESVNDQPSLTKLLSAVVPLLCSFSCINVFLQRNSSSSWHRESSSKEIDFPIDDAELPTDEDLRRFTLNEITKQLKIVMGRQVHELNDQIEILTSIKREDVSSQTDFLYKSKEITTDLTVSDLANKENDLIELKKKNEELESSVSDLKTKLEQSGCQESKKVESAISQLEVIKTEKQLMQADYENELKRREESFNRRISEYRTSVHSMERASSPVELISSLNDNDQQESHPLRALVINRLQAIQRDHENLVKKAQEQHRKEVDALKEECRLRLIQESEDHCLALRVLQTTHEEEIEEFKAKHVSMETLQLLEDNYKRKFDLLNSQFEKLVSELKEYSNDNSAASSPTDKQPEERAASLLNYLQQTADNDRRVCSRLLQEKRVLSGYINTDKTPEKRRLTMLVDTLEYAVEKMKDNEKLTKDIVPPRRPSVDECSRNCDDYMDPPHRNSFSNSKPSDLKIASPTSPSRSNLLEAHPVCPQIQSSLSSEIPDTRQLYKIPSDKPVICIP